MFGEDIILKPVLTEKRQEDAIQLIEFKQTGKVVICFSVHLCIASLSVPL